VVVARLVVVVLEAEEMVRLLAGLSMGQLILVVAVVELGIQEATQLVVQE
jgi:hypothetical protein